MRIRLKWLLAAVMGVSLSLISMNSAPADANLPGLAGSDRTSLSPPERSNSEMRFFAPPSDVVPGSISTLWRHQRGAIMHIQTDGLTEGDVVNVWWVIFNNPAACSHPLPGVSQCSALDFEHVGGDPAVAASFVWATGHVVEEQDTTGEFDDLDDAWRRNEEASDDVVRGRERRSRGRSNGGDHHGGSSRGRANAARADTADGLHSFTAQLRMDSAENALFGPGLTNPMGAEIHLVVRSLGPALPWLIHEQINSFGGGCISAPPGTGTTGPNTCVDVQFTVHRPVVPAQ